LVFSAQSTGRYLVLLAASYLALAESYLTQAASRIEHTRPFGAPRLTLDRSLSSIQLAARATNHSHELAA